MKMKTGVNIPSAPGGVILFDLDDTLVVATEVSKSHPVFATYPGYATVVQVGSVSMFVAIRPFALASIMMFLRHGFKVGFWSAGSPLYVSAIVERLVDAVRLMQSRRKESGESSSASRFRPLTVIALDQQNMLWIRNETLEKSTASTTSLPKLSVLCSASVVSGQGIVKEVQPMLKSHPHLRPGSAKPNIVLLDNLRHDMTFTFQVPEFVVTRPAPYTSVLDKTLLNVTRFIIRNPSSNHPYDFFMNQDHYVVSSKPKQIIPAAPASALPAAPAPALPAAPAPVILVS